MRDIKLDRLKELLNYNPLTGVWTWLLIRAGEETAAAREVGDRLDGKPAQAIIGGEEDDPAVKLVTRIERVIVDVQERGAE